MTADVAETQSLQSALVDHALAEQKQDLQGGLGLFFLFGWVCLVWFAFNILMLARSDNDTGLL